MPTQEAPADGEGTQELQELSPLVLVFIAANATPCLAAVARLLPAPSQYSYPAPENLGGRWAYELEEYGYDARCASGDLNGDGRPDYATLLLRDGGGFGVVLLISQPDGHYAHQFPLAKTATSGPPQEGMLSLVPRGPYLEKIGCGWHPAPVRTGLTLETVAFAFLSYGTPGSKPEHWLIYWHDGVVVVQDRCPPEAWAHGSQK